MFKKNNCSKCGKKIDKKYDFCPYCGNVIENNQEDWGMLGKNDIKGFEKTQNPFEKITESMLSKMLGSAMKMLEKEMQKEMNSQKNDMPKANIRLMINGKEISLNNTEKKPKKVKEAESKMFSEDKSKEFLKLSKEEPKTDLRRLSKKVIYEIELAGVTSIEDISVIKLENSIEIRAIAKDKAYFKIIPINLPLVDYDFSDETLVLELKA
jgi:HSP20 family molecular chaperone IbpA